MNKQAKISLLVVLILVGIFVASFVMAPLGSKPYKDKVDNDGDWLIDWPAKAGSQNKKRPN
jgi:hypothetical protein